VILQRVEQADWLSNAYLVVDEPGGTGVLIDSNDVTDPLVERVERERTTITHVLLTHHHYDHVVGVEKLAERFEVPVLAHPGCRELVGDDIVTGTIDHGDVVETGDLRIEAIHTPGHCADHLALRINEDDCLTADVLFAGTVGGTGAPGATGLGDLRASIMDRLMELPNDVRIHPGHRGPSTIAEEWENNPFIRLWRGLDEPTSEPVTVGPADAEERREAELLLWAPDYDGGNKALVRFADDGTETITGGSQIRREGDS
jgi:hydroxyacylglutathione hydrolase